MKMSANLKESYWGTIETKERIGKDLFRHYQRPLTYDERLKQLADECDQIIGKEKNDCGPTGKRKRKTKRDISGLRRRINHRRLESEFERLMRATSNEGFTPGLITPNLSEYWPRNSPGR